MIATTMLTLCCLAAASQAELRTLAGETASGGLTAIDAAEVALDTSAGPKKFPLKDLLTLKLTDSPPRAALPAVWLELVDGSLLVGSEYLCDRGTGKFTDLDGVVASFSTKRIAHVRLKESTEKIAAQWAELLANPRPGDVLVLRQGDSIDFVEGELGDVSAESVKFTSDGDLANVKRAKIDGLIYARGAAKEYPAALCQLNAHSGARLSASKLSMADGKFKVTTLSGAVVELAAGAVRDLDFSAGKLRYLSDLTPDSVERTPFLGVFAKSGDGEKFYQPRVDKAFDGGPLKLGKNVYVKGLALKSRTVLVYRLPGKFSRFESVAGIDAGVAPLGCVRLVVRADDKVLHDSLVRGGEPPLPLSLAIAGAKRLTIEVDFGEGGDVADYLDLCEARVIQ